MSMNDDDLEFKDMQCDDSPSPAYTNDDEVVATVVRYVEELKQAVHEFRESNNIPASEAVLIRRNPNGGFAIVEALGNPLDGLQRVCENSKAAEAIRAHEPSSNEEKG